MRNELNYCKINSLCIYIKLNILKYFFLAIVLFTKNSHLKVLLYIK